MIFRTSEKKVVSGIDVFLTKAENKDEHAIDHKLPAMTTFLPAPTNSPLFVIITTTIIIPVT